jgi:hypothetical protein
MSAFLQLAARDIYERSGGDMSDVLVVFPSVRARLYFARHIGNMIDKPVWMPQFASISSLMQDISGLRTADPIELIFRLHTIYTQVRGIRQEFDDFYFWGEMMLADFDEVDKYRVDAAELFRNLAEWKSMRDQFAHLSEEQIAAIQQFWGSFTPGKISMHQQEFMEVWAALGQVYHRLREQLLSENAGYEGLIARTAIEKLENGAPLCSKYKQVALVGFHILSRCEEDLFAELGKTGKALYYWDYDTFYTQRRRHEAGRFMAENLRRFPSALPEENFNLLTTGNRKIELWSVPSNTGQARMLPDFLEPLSGISEWEDNTAIVLADEELLMPVLHSVPEEVESLNITMGYPLRNSSAVAFVTLLLDLQAAFARYNGRLSFRQVLPILEHPYLVGHVPGVSELSAAIRRENRIYMDATQLASQHEMLNTVFTRTGDGRELTVYLIKVLSLFLSLLQKSENNDMQVEAEFVYRILISVRRIDDLLEQSGQKLNTGTLMRLLRKLTGSLSVPFTGEPLGGLQVMGLLETRTLDFEHLVILSTNEGVLPKTTVAPSFIPYNLRRGFGITTIEHQDSIYAYYFYRLLQRASTVTLVYNANPSGSRSGEMSRFVQQILVETDWTIERHEAPYTLHLPADIPLKAERTDKVNTMLDRYRKPADEGGHYLSPSALSNWFECGLRFYFAHLAGIRTPDELTPEVDSAMFGNIFHKAMELLYQPLIGKETPASEFEAILKNRQKITEAIDEAYFSEFFRGKGHVGEYHGNNIVIRDVLEQYVGQLLKIDKGQAPIKLVEMERKEVYPFSFKAGDKMFTVNLGGRIDRIDRRGGTLRVIDYKTGFSSKNELSASMSDLFKRNDAKRAGYVFQALYYSLLLSKSMPGNGLAEPHLFMIKEFFNREPDFKVEIKDEDLPTLADQLTVFEEMLTGCLAELFASDEPFTQTENEEVCKFCDYKAICHR